MTLRNENKEKIRNESNYFSGRTGNEIKKIYGKSSKGDAFLHGEDGYRAAD